MRKVFHKFRSLNLDELLGGVSDISIAQYKGNEQMPLTLNIRRVISKGSPLRENSGGTRDEVAQVLWYLTQQSKH